MNIGDPAFLIAAVIGTLAGSLSFMFHQLVITKNKRINELLDEVDYWRMVASKVLHLPDGTPMPDYQEWWDSQHRMPRGSRETFIADREQKEGS